MNSNLKWMTLIGAAVLSGIVLVALLAGTVLAQGPAPWGRQGGYGWGGYGPGGMMGGGMMGRGMMGGRGGMTLAPARSAGVTKLKGPAKWQHFYLYVILDVYSRFVVGWLLAEAESAELAETLITTTCRREGIQPDQLGLHSDRGPAMQSKTIAQLLIDLAVAQTFARPYTPNDNAYSEAQFKTFKYRPGFPEQFDSLVEARAWVQAFMQWYNYQHYHSALGLLTPALVHHDQTQPVQIQRQQVLATAFQTHPERFVAGQPTVAELPASVWINRPPEEA